MGVTVIEPGRLVLVEPDQLDANDILDFGAALIEEHGHMTGDSGDEQKGWSIHGAVGEAARRATGSHAKDDPASRVLRDEAARKIMATHERTEFEVNDSATKDEAVAAMRAAISTEAA